MDTPKPQEDLHNQAAAHAAALASGDAREITLDVPLRRPGGELVKVLVRRPNAGALRGLSLVELLHMNVTALQTLLPRVTEPMLHKAEVLQLDPADLVTLGTEVASFLVPKAQREQFPSA
ncbi:Phage tail protein E [Delftia tsuruhatensis]|uniref:phage tail assembly protein n=1 Tax=Delftia tsuruhatensis TaxID=180282 RepID=UPI001E7E7D6F|nr:phage tail assembly protein [Delftia tsuruhatensis]CAB5719376.1 Phage tail protein E [Delftia tsuruhatensis]CAC9687875.1 Phage tail protein E [Delftia tsuruhatensis]